MNDALVSVEPSFRDWLYDKQYRLLSWIAWHLPRSIVYFAGVRMWTEATDARERGADDIPAGLLTCEQALDRWNARA